MARITRSRGGPRPQFIANGGDSLKAVLLTAKLFGVTGVEVDYLTVLQAESASDLLVRTVT